MIFGERLRELREKAGLTQAALAEASGLSLRTIQSWEQGRRTPVSPDFFTLAKALRVSADHFAGITVDGLRRPPRGHATGKPTEQQRKKK